MFIDKSMASLGSFGVSKMLVTPIKVRGFKVGSLDTPVYACL